MPDTNLYISKINVGGSTYDIKDSKANEIEITTTNVTPTDENVEMWVNLGQKQTIYIPETAEDISYDNQSGLPNVDNVQDAIDSILVTMRPKLTITAPSGSSLTITNGTTTITGEATSGTFTTEIPKLGTWTITATLNSKTTTDTVSITELGREYEVELEFFSATLSITTDSGAEVYLDGVSKGVATSGTLSITITKSGTYSVSAKVNGIGSEEQTATFTTDEEVISKTLNFRKISLTAPSGSSITLTDGDTTYTDTSAGIAIIYYIPNDGTWTATATLSGESTSDSVVVGAYQTYSIELAFTHIYGAEWDGSSSTVLSRTDESALFVDPNPYVANGSHPGSSPFDNLMPWKGMEIVTISDNSLVKIPKFWYKITTNGSSIKFQIADKATSGFNVSPAHQDRGDGVGERDYIYVGRYHSISGYKSQSGAQPLVNITRATGRTNIKNLGTGFYLWDYATLVTIWLLYIVEFANWNSQTCIGYGCSSGGSKYNTGATTSMPYHTGTTATSRTSYASGCQYRYIEDLWGNVLDWCDGIRFSSSNIYIYKNPSEFSDSSGGVNTGTRPTSGNYITSWKQPSTAGYDWAIYPGTVGGSNSTYVPDYCYYYSSGVVLHVGGNYNQNLNHGLFYLNGNNSASDSNANIGVQVLPHQEYFYFIV